MTTQERLKTVDDLWRMVNQPDHASRRFELKNGVIYEVHPPGREHGKVTLRFGSRILIHVEANDLGEVTVETGYYDPEDTLNAQGPDIAFTSKARMPDESVKGYVPQMPDLAVEVKSPENTIKSLHEKAEYYLRHGAKLVWLVYPGTHTLDVCTLVNDTFTVKTLREGDVLDGGEVLPGFQLPIREIFP
jgi:Uma2 family endonuclease